MLAERIVVDVVFPAPGFEVFELSRPNAGQGTTSLLEIKLERGHQANSPFALSATVAQRTSPISE